METFIYSWLAFVLRNCLRLALLNPFEVSYFTSCPWLVCLGGKALKPLRLLPGDCFWLVPVKWVTVTNTPQSRFL